MDEVGDDFEFIGGGVDVFESVGGLVADGGHAHGAEAEKIFEDAGLLERDVFNGNEVDDVSAGSEKRGGAVVDEALVSDVEGVAFVNVRTDEAGDDKDADENVTDEVVQEIAKRQPLRAVFRDSRFKNSPSKINVEEIFKMLSPDTSIKVL